MAVAEKHVRKPQTRDVPNKRQDEFDEKTIRRRRRYVSFCLLERMRNSINNKIKDRNLSENIKFCDDVSSTPNKLEELEPISMEETPDSKRFCKMDDDKDDKDNVSEVLRSKVDEEDDEKIQTLELREMMKNHIKEFERSIMWVDLYQMMDDETNYMMLDALEEIKRGESLEKEEHESTEMTWLKESRFSDPWMFADHELTKEEHNDLENEGHKEDTFAYVLWRLFGCGNGAEYEMRSYSACFPNDDLKKNKDKLPKDEYMALVRSKVEEIFKPLLEDANAFECVNFRVVDGTINQFITFLYEIETGNDKDLTMELIKIINYVKGLRMMLDEKRFIDSISSGRYTDGHLHLSAPPSSQFRRMAKTKNEKLTKPMQEAIAFLDLLDSRSSSPPCAAAPISPLRNCGTVDCSFDFYY